MKNKVMKKILMIMLSSTILMGSASVTAFAQANENAEQTEAVEQVKRIFRIVFMSVTLRRSSGHLQARFFPMMWK